MQLPLTSPALSWRFRDATKRSAWLTAVVPGCVHDDLLRAGKIPDPFFGTNELGLRWIEERDWEYRASFAVPAALLGHERVELCADGLDTVAEVFLNGTRVASTENMFVAHRRDVKSLLRAAPRENELRVVFRSAMDYVRNTRTEFTPPQEFNDPVGNCVRIRKQQCQFGWDWGPRFVTAGIWRDLRLEAWSGNRLADVRITQTHRRGGAVTLGFAPELARPDAHVRLTGTVSLAGRVVAKIENRESTIENPRLWWPAGQGAQPLYAVELVAHDADGRPLGTLSRRVGLRTVALDRSADAGGERFRFLVNGRPVFMKGANWIPVHAFVAGKGRDAYARDLRAAVAANMNCVRLWGGGVYESEDFYDLCDELGLLVWHDFMFACTLYPSDPVFLASVATEAEQQIKRLRHRACLALWCGNNELVQINGPALRADAKLRAGYEKLFHGVLAEAVARNDGVTPYWPTGEWRGTYENGHALGEKSGDTHYWDVWHARHPVKDYEKWRFRFVSEFGMQSYSSPETNRTFCPADDTNVFGPAMENHQKNRSGNQIILDYVSRRYRLPKSQDDLIYLSQLNQAYCMKTGVEHYRRLMPHCMGAIYWQLNDCWPVASWSSIEFTGRWKALHYEARRFFAPALVTAHVDGDEGTTIGNYRTSSVGKVALHTVYDAPRAAVGRLGWAVCELDGRTLRRGAKKVALRPGEARCQTTLDLARELARHGRDRLYLRIALAVDGATVSEETVFLAPPRFLRLPRGTIAAKLRRLGPARFALTLRSAVFQHRAHFDFPGHPFTASDNFVELYPGETREIEISLEAPASVAALRRALRWRSLADTY